MKIGNVTMGKIQDEIVNLLSTYHKSIDQAYIKSEDEILSISLKVKLSPDDEKIKIEVGISFVSDKVKDSVTVYADEKQQVLFSNSAS